MWGGDRQHRPQDRLGRLLPEESQTLAAEIIDLSPRQVFGWSSPQHCIMVKSINFKAKQTSILILAVLLIKCINPSKLLYLSVVSVSQICEMGIILVCTLGVMTSK